MAKRKSEDREEWPYRGFGAQVAIAILVAYAIAGTAIAIAVAM